VRLLRVGTDNRDHGVAEVLELGLGLGVEEREGGNVDRVVGVLGVDDNGGAGRGSLAGAADADAGKEVLGVPQVSLLLGLAQTLALLGLGLFVALLVAPFREGCGLGCQLLGNALGLGLLVGGGFGVSLGLCLGGLLGLLALDFGVFGGVP
jgi:hypothetical protein